MHFRHYFIHLHPPLIQPKLIIHSFIQYHRLAFIFIMSDPKTHCIVCNKITKSQCISCKSINYCSIECLQSHRPVHKKFCKDSYIYSNVPRLCECCGLETNVGCKTCHRPYCSAICYTNDYAIHDQICRPISMQEMKKYLSNEDTSKKYKLPILKDGTPLMILPFKSDQAIHNLFDPLTDKRMENRMDEKMRKQLHDSNISLCIAEDYVMVMRSILRNRNI